MGDVNDLFIPYEQALALKELGFDSNCIGSYCQTPKFDEGTFMLGNTYTIKAPTYSQTFKFFRDKEYAIMDKIFDEDRIMYAKDIINLDSKKLYKGARFNSYEEAELDCLKKLIELEKK